MNNPLFAGVCTALVTPFINGQVNYPMMEQLIKRQLDAGIQNIVISGTTGEASTLTDAEKLEMFRRSKAYVGDSCRIIAGTGSNATVHTVALSKAAEKVGVDGVLVVSPYYNKATEDGLFTHYVSIADAISIPMILYNVPSRTGVDIPISVYKQLSHIPNIVGVKEASPDITKVTKTRNSCADSFSVWSGNDDLAVPCISLGGKGLISVLSNVCPAETAAMVGAALNGDFNTAAALQRQLQPLTDLLFCEVNPIPVKAAMKIIGYDCGECRLPLTQLKNSNYQKLTAILT